VPEVAVRPVSRSRFCPRYCHGRVVGFGEDEFLIVDKAWRRASGLGDVNISNPDGVSFAAFRGSCRPVFPFRGFWPASCSPGDISMFRVWSQTCGVTFDGRVAWSAEPRGCASRVARGDPCLQADWPTGCGVRGQGNARLRVDRAARI